MSLNSRSKSFCLLPKVLPVCNVCAINLSCNRFSVKCNICKKRFCENCSFKFSFLDFSQMFIDSICKNCYSFYFKNEAVKISLVEIENIKGKIKTAKEEIIEINLKETKSLERLRTLNLLFGKLQDDWSDKEKKIIKSLENIKVRHFTLEQSHELLKKQINSYENELSDLDTKIDSMKSEISEIEELNAKNNEKILSLESMIVEEIKENLKIDQNSKKFEEKKKENEESLKTDDAGLNEKIKQLKEKVEEARNMNAFMKKRLRELKPEEEEIKNPRVSMESRGESYKKLIEQWNYQENQLKMLNDLYYNDPIVRKKCSCTVF